MTVSATWTGGPQLTAAIQKIVKDVDTASTKILQRGALKVEGEAKKNFVGSHPRGTPRPASADSTKPMVVTGALRASITSDPVKKNGVGDYSITIGPRRVYGRRVELGYNGSRGYPYFTPAVKSVTPQLQTMSREVWGSYFGK